MLAIEAENLSKYYGKTCGIESVTLDVEEGEVYGFIGPNGAGKSTTIRTILGLLKPTGGRALVFGEDVLANGAEIRRRIGYLPSEVNYYDGMTPNELLHYSARFFGKQDTRLIRELADQFELALHTRIRNLSFGNKKKVAIVQCLLHQPDLIILDEPTAGLDPLIKNRFFDRLKQEHQKGVTIFISSHVLSEIQRLCSRAAVIRKGKVIAIEHMHELLRKQMKKCRVVFTDVPVTLAMPAGIQNTQWQGTTLTFEYVGQTKDLLRWMLDLNLVDTTVEEPDLEDIFMNYYQR
jgi:ABC-2 type transport system ATP-binding protein